MVKDDRQTNRQTVRRCLFNRMAYKELIWFDFIKKKKLFFFLFRFVLLKKKSEHNNTKQTGNQANSQTGNQATKQPQSNNQ